MAALQDRLSHHDVRLHQQPIVGQSRLATVCSLYLVSKRMVLILVLWNQVQAKFLRLKRSLLVKMACIYTVLVLTCFCLQNFIVSVATNNYY